MHQDLALAKHGVKIEHHFYSRKPCKAEVDSKSPVCGPSLGRLEVWFGSILLQKSFSGKDRKF